MDEFGRRVFVGLLPARPQRECLRRMDEGNLTRVPPRWGKIRNVYKAETGETSPVHTPVISAVFRRLERLQHRGPYDGDIGTAENDS